VLFTKAYCFQERNKEKKLPGRKDESKNKKKLTSIDGQVIFKNNTFLMQVYTGVLIF